MIKKRWKNIKDYKKKRDFKKKKPTGSHKSSGSDDSDDEYLNIEYLETSRTPRATKSNIDETIGSPTSTAVSEALLLDLNQQVALGESELDNEVIQENLDDEEVIENIEASEEAPSKPANATSSQFSVASPRIEPGKRKPTKRKASQSEMLSEFVAVRKESNKILSSLAKSASNTEPEENIIDRYFKTYAMEIRALPTDLQVKCHRELQPTIQAAIYKYQDLADSRKADT